MYLLACLINYTIKVLFNSWRTQYLLSFLNKKQKFKLMEENKTNAQRYVILLSILYLCIMIMIYMFFQKETSHWYNENEQMF